MFKSVLMYFDQIVREKTLLLFVATFLVVIATVVIRSNIVFVCVYSFLSAIVLQFLSKGRLVGLRSIFASFMFLLFVVVILNVLFFCIDYILLKYFFNLYMQTYLTDAGVSLCVVLSFSFFTVLILPFLAALFNFDFKGKMLCFCAKEYLTQTVFCSTILLFFLYLNSIPFENVEIYTSALTAKSFLAILAVYVWASYANVLRE
ncbi:hypothetical protein [Maridesulfovibrio sp.]|uniref:hypothetical protein n=1 Tax=Maridesulfovibrio sp. TaxID=2795000 RepID=UPI002A18B30C|nr:hypothetical protein [Maridesulfovibrio sp.]